MLRIMDQVLTYPYYLTKYFPCVSKRLSVMRVGENYICKLGLDTRMRKIVVLQRQTTENASPG